MSALSRNDQIVKRYDELLSLAEVGKEFGITRERVRQIVVAKRGKTHGHDRTVFVTQARRLFHAVAVAAKLAHNQRHGTLRRYHMGCSCAECRRAHADYHRKYSRIRQERKTGKPVKPYSPERNEKAAAHGNPHYYAEYWRRIREGE